MNKAVSPKKCIKEDRTEVDQIEEVMKGCKKRGGKGIDIELVCTIVETLDGVKKPLKKSIKKDELILSNDTNEGSFQMDIKRNKEQEDDNTKLELSQLKGVKKRPKRKRDDTKLIEINNIEFEDEDQEPSGTKAKTEDDESDVEWSNKPSKKPKKSKKKKDGCNEPQKKKKCIRKKEDDKNDLRDVERGNWLATGKRRRRQRDPNAWESSIPTTYECVLCLGMSYPEKVDSKNLLQPLESVEQAVELVRRNILTEMDGRDLARCLALESSNQYLAYTISLCSSARYSHRHLSLNFNRSNFSTQLKAKWGDRVRFKQIILDYFWIPSGSWMMTHWKKTFFENTIPSFVTQNLLMPDDGVVYLPFCLYVVGQLVAAGEILAQYYKISFLYKYQLSEHALWLATSQISPAVMQNWFGKAINQEDTYCTLTASEVYTSTEFDGFRKDDVLNVLRGIEDFEQVRMIKLQVLKSNDTSSHKPPPGTLYVPGFIGLKLHHLVTRGMDDLPGGKRYNTKTTNSKRRISDITIPTTSQSKDNTPILHSKKCEDTLDLSSTFSSKKSDPALVSINPTNSSSTRKPRRQKSPKPKKETKQTPDEITINSKHSNESPITTSDFDSEVVVFEKKSKIKGPNYLPLKTVYSSLSKSLAYRKSRSKTFILRAAMDEYNHRIW